MSPKNHVDTSKYQFLLSQFVISKLAPPTTTCKTVPEDQQILSHLTECTSKSKLSAEDGGVAPVVQCLSTIFSSLCTSRAHTENSPKVIRSYAFIPGSASIDDNESCSFPSPIHISPETSPAWLLPVLGLPHDYKQHAWFQITGRTRNYTTNDIISLAYESISAHISNRVLKNEEEHVTIDVAAFKVNCACQRPDATAACANAPEYVKYLPSPRDFQVFRDHVAHFAMYRCTAHVRPPLPAITWLACAACLVSANIHLATVDVMKHTDNKNYSEYLILIQSYIADVNHGLQDALAILYPESSESFSFQLSYSLPSDHGNAESFPCFSVIDTDLQKPNFDENPDSNHGSRECLSLSKGEVLSTSSDCRKLQYLNTVSRILSGSDETHTHNKASAADTDTTPSLSADTSAVIPLLEDLWRDIAVIKHLEEQETASRALEMEKQAFLELQRQQALRREQMDSESSDSDSSSDSGYSSDSECSSEEDNEDVEDITADSKPDAIENTGKALDPDIAVQRGGNDGDADVGVGTPHSTVAPESPAGGSEAYRGWVQRASPGWGRGGANNHSANGCVSNSRCESESSRHLLATTSDADHGSASDSSAERETAGSAESRHICTQPLDFALHGQLMWIGDSATPCINKLDEQCADGWDAWGARMLKIHWTYVTRILPWLPQLQRSAPDEASRFLPSSLLYFERINKDSPLYDPESRFRIGSPAPFPDILSPSVLSFTGSPDEASGSDSERCVGGRVYLRPANLLHPQFTLAAAAVPQAPKLLWWLTAVFSRSAVRVTPNQLDVPHPFTQVSLSEYGYPPGSSFQSSFPTIERAYRTLVGILAALHVLYDAQAVSSLGIPAPMNMVVWQAALAHIIQVGLTYTLETAYNDHTSQANDMDDAYGLYPAVCRRSCALITWHLRDKGWIREQTPLTAPSEKPCVDSRDIRTGGDEISCERAEYTRAWLLEAQRAVRQRIIHSLVEKGRISDHKDEDVEGIYCSVVSEAVQQQHEAWSIVVPAIVETVVADLSPSMTNDPNAPLTALHPSSFSSKQQNLTVPDVQTPVLSPVSLTSMNIPLMPRLWHLPAPPADIRLGMARLAAQMRVAEAANDAGEVRRLWSVLGVEWRENGLEWGLRCLRGYGVVVDDVSKSVE